MRFALGRPRSRRRAATAATAWVVLLTALALPMPQAGAIPDETIADDFNPAAWDGSDGSLPWATDWSESGESDGVDDGSIRIGDEPHCPTNPCLLLGRDSGPDASVTRQLDLSGYAGAQLEFDYDIHEHSPGAGTASFWVSDNGGADWRMLDSWPLDTDQTNSVSYDISEYIDSATAIRFAVNGNADDSHMNVDNLVITASGRQGYFDEFASLGWDGSDGSIDWALTPWQESEGDGEAAGLIQSIGNTYCASGNCLRIEGSTSSAAHNMVREVDLSGATFASLLFNYRRDNYTSCSVRLEVSDNGGGSWNPITTYTANGGDASQQMDSHDITAYAAADTQIRFISNGTCGPGQYFFADNIWVYTDASPGSGPDPTQPPAFYTVAGGGGVGGGDDLATTVDPIDPNSVSNETSIGTGTGTSGIQAAAWQASTSTLFAVEGGQVGTISTTTGVFSALPSTVGTGSGSGGSVLMDDIVGLAFDPTTGDLYGTHRRWLAEALLFKIDTTTGALRTGEWGGDDYVEIEPSGFNYQVTDLAFDPTSGQAYVIHVSELFHTFEFSTLDPATGDTNQFGSVLDDLRSLDFDSEGRLWATTATGSAPEQLHELDKISGASLSSIDLDNGFDYEALAIPNPPPPNQAPVFDQDLLDRSDSEGSFIDIESPATDPNPGDTLTYSGVDLPDGISIDPASGRISGVLTANSSGVHTVALTVTDNGSPSMDDTDTFTWTVTSGDPTYLLAAEGGGLGNDALLTAVDRSNSDPAINEVTIGTGMGRTNAEGAAIQPGSSTLFASHQNQIGTVDVVSGVFSALPSLAGTGNGSAGLETFDNIEALSFHPATGDLYAIHRPGSGTTESMLLQINPATGAHVAGAFGGDDYIEVQSQDSHYQVPGIAHDPIDGTLHIIHWRDIGSESWELATLDPATGATTTIGTLPDDLTGLSFDETGRLYGITDKTSGGTLYQIDKTDGSVNSSITVDNTNEYEAIAIALPAEPNQPPVFGQDLLDRTDPEGTAISLSAAATDPDLHRLNYSASDLPPGVTIDPGTGLISGTIDFAAEAASPYDVTIAVTDDGIPNLVSTDTFTWTVTDFNHPPVFDQDLLNRTDTEGTVVSLSAAATDPDSGDVVTYGIAGLPPGLLIDPFSGLISGTIDYTAATGSPYAVTVTASDDRLPPETAVPDTFTWTVTNTNQPPVMANPGPQTTPELAPFTIVVTATDPDGTVPGIGDSGTLPAWAAITDNLDGTATINGTPGIGDSGTTTVTVTASDGSLTDDAVFDITVTNTNVAPTIVNPGNQGGDEGSPFSVTVAASDPDGTTVSFTDSGTLPAWASLTDNGDDTATVFGTPGYTDSGTTTITITASDGSLTDDAVFDIVVGNTNRQPIVDPIADHSTTETVALVPITVTASDPDGTIPTLAAPSLPGWATLIDNGDGTATITGTPGYDDAGTTTVTVLAFDGSLIGTGEFDLTVANTNRAPVLTPLADQNIAEGTPLPPVTATANDPDGEVVALAASGLPGWASFIDNGDSTGTITGTPGYGDTDTTTVTIYGEDGGTPNLSDSISFDITVTNTNRAPVLSPVLNQTVAETTPLSPVTITAADPDGTIPNIAASGLPAWATFVDNGDGTGTVTGAPGSSDAGVSTVTVTASDGALFDTRTFDLTVTESNIPPAFDNPLPGRTDPEGTTILIDAGATDPNGDTPVYSATGLPPGITLNVATGEISGTLAYDAAGAYSIAVGATDDGTPALTTTAAFNWTVTDTNRPPALSPIASVFGPEQTELTFTAAANDPDGHNLTYTIAGAPLGAAMDPDTGLFTWTPGEAHGTGSYAVTVIATDAGTPALADTKTVTITVTEVNNPPIIERISDQHDDEGDSVSLDVLATDPDIPLNSLSFSATGLPTGLSIDTASGAISGTVPSGTEGTHSVTVTVIDDGSPQQQAEISFTWMIGDTNHPPSMDAIADRTVPELTEVSLRPRADDPDGDTITFAIAGAPPGASFDPATGAFRWVPNEEQGPGVYRLSIIAEDSGTPELVSIRVVTITVTESNQAPTIAFLPDRIDDALAAISIPIAATDDDLPANSLTYTATELPPGLAIDPGSGLISGEIEAASEPGVTRYEVVITAIDDGVPALDATVGFAWTVVTPQVTPENFPPSVTLITGQNTDVGTTVALQVEATDAEPLVFSAGGLPPGLTIDDTTGLITGTVTNDAAGTHEVTITVSEVGDSPLHTSVVFPWMVTDRAAAEQKNDVVVAIVADGGETTTDSRPLRRGLVVMSAAAVATTESLRMPLLLLLGLMTGFATIGRVGLYPLLWGGDRHTGTISFYDPELNFGLIQPDEGGEAVFVHAHALPRRQRGLLATGMRLRYRVLASDNRSNAWGAVLEPGDE